MSTLLDAHDAVLFDLDGTLFRGGTAVPGATEAVAGVARRGVRVGYLTNNGSRNAAQVTAHLRDLGFDAGEHEVVTSGQAAARVLAERLDPGAAVLVVGSAALGAEVTGTGLSTTTRAEDAVAVVQGHSPDTDWRTLAEACLAIRAGATWVACNVDATLPDERGELPGNGSMVAALVAATSRNPVVVGKPEAALYREAVARLDAHRPLMVGDRLDTDIAGANAVDMPSLLVLTGVSTAADLLAAAESDRPRYVAVDLGALTEPAESSRPGDRPGWRVRRDGEQLLLAHDGGRPSDALPALCGAHWAAGGGPVRVAGEDGDSEVALRSLGLGSATDRPT